MTFQVGDKVIYPNHGLGVVQGIETKTILGTTCGFYHLKMVANETTVLVPVDNVDGVGLRRAIGDEEIDRLFTLLGDGKIDNHQNWKGRFKDNSDRMRTGSIYDVVEVLKSLTFLARSKNLSFREKRMLDRAKFLVISEISEVARGAALTTFARAAMRAFIEKQRSSAVSTRDSIAGAASRITSETSEMIRNFARSSIRFSRNDRLLDLARNVRLFSTSATSKIEPLRILSELSLKRPFQF